MLKTTDREQQRVSRSCPGHQGRRIGGFGPVAGGLNRVLLSMVALFMMLCRPFTIQSQSPEIVELSRPDSVPVLTFIDSHVFGGDISAPASVFGPPTNVLRDPDGRFLTVAHGLDRVLIYDRSGGYQGTIGRPGQGPGEFEGIQRLYLGPADSLLVFEFGTLTIFDPDRQFARQTPWSVQPDYGVKRLKDGRFIVAAIHRTRDAAGYPLHLLNASGSLVRSFGTDYPILDPDRPRITKRLLADAGSQTYWVTRSDRYELELWNAEGQHRKTIHGNSEWFEPWPPAYRQKPGQERPRPFIRAIISDSAGRILVAFGVPDPDWRPGIRYEEGALRSWVLDREFDTVVEVIDPTSNRLIARGQMDKYVVGFADPQTVYAFTNTRAGETVVNVWTLNGGVR